MKRIAIINPMTNHNLDNKTIRSKELYLIKDHIESNGDKAYFVCSKLSKHKNIQSVFLSVYNLLTRGMSVLKKELLFVPSV